MITRSVSIDSPVGRLVIRERDGAIVAIDWDRDSCASDTSATLRRAVAALEGYFAGTLTAFDLPCAAAGTAFQKRVWEAMCRIRYGETITYGELAREIGSAPRAVGAACGANPIPIVVPCHRVVAAAGKPGGYSGGGGLDTKARLLALERGERILPGTWRVAS